MHALSFVNPGLRNEGGDTQKLLYQYNPSLLLKFACRSYRRVFIGIYQACRVAQLCSGVENASRIRFHLWMDHFYRTAKWQG